MIKKQKKTIKEEIRENINEDFYESKNGGLVWREDNKFFDACDLEDYIWDICRQILQRFIEETKPYKAGGVIAIKNIREADGIIDCLERINQKQQQWLKENL